VPYVFVLLIDSGPPQNLVLWRYQLLLVYPCLQTNGFKKPEVVCTFYIWMAMKGECGDVHDYDKGEAEFL
jgi:hypothetical protein